MSNCIYVDKCISTLALSLEYRVICYYMGCVRSFMFYSIRPTDVFPLENWFVENPTLY
jgi:hypothetical protein